MDLAKQELLQAERQECLEKLRKLNELEQSANTRQAEQVC